MARGSIDGRGGEWRKEESEIGFSHHKGQNNPLQQLFTYKYSKNSEYAKQDGD